MRIPKKIIIVFILLAVNMLAGVLLSFNMAAGGSFVQLVSPNSLALMVGVSMVFGSALLFWIIGLYYNLQHRVQKDVDIYKEQVEMLTKDIQLSKESIRERDTALVKLRKQLGDITNLNSIYEKMIKSLRSVVSNQSTKLKESYQLLEEAKEKALQAEKLKSVFLSNINHEIRTPINGILGFSSFLGSPSLTPERRRQYCDILSNSTGRFLDTFNDILFYSQIQAGDIDVSITTFNVNLLVANVMNLAMTYIANQGKSLSVNCKNDLGSKVFVRGFENGYFKILSNLVNNAVKFTKNGSVDIEYSVSGDVIRFEVADTGIGLDSSRKDTIFESFTQDEQSLSRHYEGSGLGLSICKGLANLMNGTIGVESHKNIGSKFWVELPLLAEDKADIDIYNAIEAHISRQPFTGIVLVVTVSDDDFSFISDFCATYNIRAEQTLQGTDTMDYLKDSNDVQISIIDVQSSVLESIHFAQQILDVKPDMKFAFITDLELSDADREKLSAFSEHIITKPVSSFALSKILNW